MDPFDAHDRSTLRVLVEQLAAAAGNGNRRQTAALWKKLNDREPERPMAYIAEIPWNELSREKELEPLCVHPFCRQLEIRLRRTLYQWNHLRLDMVVEPVVHSPLVIHDSGFGMQADADYRRLDPNTTAPARHYKSQIRDEKDVERIQLPTVTHDEEATEENLEALGDAVGDIMPVRKQGIAGYWFAPWDVLVTWWGVQEALMDLIMRPDLVCMAMDRLVGAFIARLGQWQTQNLLAFSEGNHRVGSGGLGYVSDLPQQGFDDQRVRPCDQWGSSTAQILGEVSPEMHEKFALRYERRWLERFGLTYYGCCEPLHNKAEILRSIPNLRKVSVSPWADIDEAVRSLGGSYVLSYKPNPAVFAGESWDPGSARKTLRTALEKMKGCAVEVVMKDISTVRHEPQRLWEWCAIAAEEVRRAA